MTRLIEEVTSFFSGGDQLPWCSRGTIQVLTVQSVRRKFFSHEAKRESIIHLSRALVHSRQQVDVQRGIDMLKASLLKNSSPLEKRETIYLMAVGYYRRGDFPKSRILLDNCLEIEPDWRQALSLKKAIEDRITKDGVIGIRIIATAVGLIAGGIVAALARRN
ncbi:mitochondria fission 1 protein [Artemisia annua]|uniref:Mitochondrial fission 1 protein n=1 Tax=Artemisia annua TaxID=35608 RepID=A0A2U1P5U0_ARTAN|nr:mitochondria fission 1 protein [Artemisia annua]